LLVITVVMSYSVSLLDLFFLSVSGFFQPHDVTFFGLWGLCPIPSLGLCPWPCWSISSPRLPASAPPKPKSWIRPWLSLLLQSVVCCLLCADQSQPSSSSFDLLTCVAKCCTSFHCLLAVCYTTCDWCRSEVVCISSCVCISEVFVLFFGFDY